MAIISEGRAPNGARIIIKDDFIAKTPEEDARVYAEQMRVQQEIMRKIAMESMRRQENQSAL